MELATNAVNPVGWRTTSVRVTLTPTTKYYKVGWSRRDIVIGTPIIVTIRPAELDPGTNAYPAIDVTPDD